MTGNIVKNVLFVNMISHRGNPLQSGEDRRNSSDALSAISVPTRVLSQTVCGMAALLERLVGKGVAIEFAIELGRHS